MQLSWRQRLERDPGLWEFKHWPVFPIDTVPAQHRKGFLRNQQIVARALAGQPIRAVAQQLAVSPGWVTQLLNRCLGGDERTDPPLTRALIPHQRLKPGQRVRPLPTLTHPQGTQYAFQALLAQVPGLTEGLDAVIRNKLKDSPKAQRLTPQGFHGAFKRLLAEAHWPSDHYPYTDASMAYESVRRYLHLRSQELRLSRARKKQQRVLAPPDQQQRRALRATQIDEHTVDLQGRVHLVLNDELIPRRLARVSLLVAEDVDTHCILGYHLALTQHPDQQDMLTLIANCIEPWKPMTLTTPGLSYMKGATFPSGLQERLPITFGTVQMDNAWMHRAHSITDLLCRQMGARLHFSRPATPKTRALVESLFHYINQHGSHRFASTTGSYPTDPIKESKKNRKQPPVISFRTLDEAISILLSEYNVRPQANLGNATPLELFRYHHQTHYIRHVPPGFYRQLQVFMLTKEVPIHWYTHEKRAPFINFMYVRYDGPGLIQALNYGKRVVIRYDIRDIRTVHAYTLEGQDLGELRASKAWRRYPHSITIRRFLHNELKAHHLNARDPLASYFHHLLEDSDKPKNALQMMRVYTEFTQDGASALYLDRKKISNKEDTERPSFWHTQMAKHRR